MQEGVVCGIGVLRCLIEVGGGLVSAANGARKGCRGLLQLEGEQPRSSNLRRLSLWLLT